MRKTIFIITALFTSLVLQAQMFRNIIVQAPEGKGIYLFINNRQINPQPMQEVKVTGLTENFYTVKTVFANGRNVQANLYLPPMTEIVYSLLPVSPDTYEFAISGVSPVDTAMPVQGQVFSWGNLPDINTGINIQIINNNSNQNIHPTEPITGETVYVEGYSGDVGCQPPIDEARFQSMLRTIENQDYDDTREQIARQIIRSNCMVVDQLVAILRLFDFDDVKLSLAKYAFDYIYDIENYYLVNDVLTFDSDKEELQKFIINRGY